MRILPFLPVVFLFAGSGANTAPRPAVAHAAHKAPDEAGAVLSPEFRKCFGKDAPLDGDSYPCLDREYHRLDALLTAEYRGALMRQPNEMARQRLQRNERNWWRIRFRHCRDDVGDLGGSTADVVNEFCEIDTLTQRIVRLRHYGR